jgi:hypothetical protein
MMKMTDCWRSRGGWGRLNLDDHLFWGGAQA